MSDFLRCDATGCDHRETVSEITEAMVGKPCPKCGSNLLTSEDFAAHQAVFKPLIDAMEKAGLVRRSTSERPGAVRLNYHEGEVRISFDRDALKAKAMAAMEGK